MTDTLYAFWEYDQLPYLLGGRIVRFTENGRVRVHGYDGMTFDPVLIRPNNIGEKLVKDLNALEKEYEKAQRALKDRFIQRRDELVKARVG